MTEEQSKGYRGCPSGFHFVQHVQIEPLLDAEALKELRILHEARERSKDYDRIL
jgi:hypothetical protein